jgi:hypothetical protein
MNVTRYNVFIDDSGKVSYKEDPKGMIVKWDDGMSIDTLRFNIKILDDGWEKPMIYFLEDNDGEWVMEF